MRTEGTFEAVAETHTWKDWLRLPFTGCDGVAKTGLEWVRRGLLAATVVVPPTMSLAFAIMTKAIRSGVEPPLRTLRPPNSFPAFEEITAKIELELVRTSFSGDQFVSN
jgi:ribose transport system substrate-binding protein